MFRDFAAICSYVKSQYPTSSITPPATSRPTISTLSKLGLRFSGIANCADTIRCQPSSESKSNCCKQKPLIWVFYLDYSVSECDSSINSARADVGTSVLRPSFTVRIRPCFISRYKLDRLIPIARAASRGDIAIGVFIWEIYLSFLGLLTLNLVRHPSQGSYVLTIFSHDVCSLLRVSQDFFLPCFGAFSGQIEIYDRFVHGLSTLFLGDPDDKSQTFTC